MPDQSVERVAALLMQGMQKIREGRIAQARTLCDQALQLAPGNPDALHLMGVISLHGNDPATALGYLERAVAVQPAAAAFWANLAYARVGLNRHSEALAAFEQAARVEPGEPEWQLGAGNCLALMGRAAEAQATLRQLVSRHPGFVLGWFNLANVLRDQALLDGARTAYVRVIELAPQFAQAHCNLGMVLYSLERFEEAEQAYRTSIARDPAYVPAYLNLAVTLNFLRRHVDAESLCREALRRDPRQKNAWPVLGRALAGQGRWNDALQCWERAVREHPGSADALGDLGDALARTGRVHEALRVFERAHASGAMSPFTQFFKASALFSAGRLAEGAAAYVGRAEHTAYVERHPESPLADRLPEDMPERIVGLIGEQGIGDELFFLRYAPLLKARGFRIRFCGSAKVCELLARNEGFEDASTHPESLRGVDCRILVGDLPFLLGAPRASPLAPPGQPAGVPTMAGAQFNWHCRVYWPEIPPPLALSPLPDKLAAAHERLRQLGPPPYIGVTWRAGTGLENQRGKVWFLYKEIAQDTLAQALQGMEGGTLVSLQRGPRAGETENLARLVGRPVHDLSRANEDLEEILALLGAVDEYVGVSNTNVHLRAGIGKATRVLVPWPADWRWLSIGNESPWFPGCTVYRQHSDGDWSASIRRLRDDLNAAPRLPA